MSGRHLPRKFLKPKPKRKGPRKLNARQALFVAEYLKDLNASAACLRAGYETGKPNVRSAALLAHESIAAAIQKALDARLRGVESTGERVILEAAGIAHSDIREALDANGQIVNPKQLPDGIARAVSSIRTITGPDGKTTTEIRLWDKVAALTLLAKYHKLLTEKIEIAGSVEVRPVAEMSDAEIRAELEANRRAIDAALGPPDIHVLPEPSFS